MKALVSTYFLLSIFLIVFIGLTPLSFYGDVIRLVNWLIVVSITITTLLLLLGIKTNSLFFWKIGLALIVVCLLYAVTSVTYNEDMDVYSWRVASTFGLKLKPNKGIFESMEIINFLSLPVIILIDIYLWINLVRNFLKSR